MMPSITITVHLFWRLIDLAGCASGTIPLSISGCKLWENHCAYTYLCWAVSVPVFQQEYTVSLHVTLLPYHLEWGSTNRINVRCWLLKQTRATDRVYTYTRYTHADLSSCRYGNGLVSIFKWQWKDREVWHLEENQGVSKLTFIEESPYNNTSLPYILTWADLGLGLATQD